MRKYVPLLSTECGETWTGVALRQRHDAAAITDRFVYVECEVLPSSRLAGPGELVPASQVQPLGVDVLLGH